ncbi:GyrI-like domain-containing protein, partial [Escherichia coli]
WYCLFNYTGSKESYQQAISTLYVHFLSPRNLSRREGYDIEVIQKKHDDTYSIEYFLPIVLCPPGEDVDIFVR